MTCGGAVSAVGAQTPRSLAPHGDREPGEGRGLGLSRTGPARAQAGAAGRALREAPPQAAESGEGLAGDAPELHGPRTGGKGARPPRKPESPQHWAPGRAETLPGRGRLLRKIRTPGPRPPRSAEAPRRPLQKPPRPALEPTASPLGTHRGDVARVKLGRLLQERQPRVRVHHVLRVGRHEARGVDAGPPVRCAVWTLQTRTLP